MSPIAWDLGHIANFEELWLVQRASGCEPLRSELGSIYDAFTAPRRERGQLPYLRSTECLRYLGAVRERTLDCLERADLSEKGGDLLAGGFVYELIARHEQQHSETILQTLQLMTMEPYDPPGALTTPAGTADCCGMVPVPDGEFEMGVDGAWFSYDNERPRHVRRVGSFEIDVVPVTNRDFIDFVEDGGYAREDLWSREGWEWLQGESASLPRYWERDGSTYLARSFAERVELDPARPVCHVSWFEADAFARWAGKRLPTEAEWEKAASWDDASGEKHRYPWGSEDSGPERANLDQLAFSTAEVGAYPEGRSPCGALGMVGDVWEWTESSFDGYRGFRPFPYREYSEPFFGDRFKVLRGGSWATQPDAVSTTFRNWDFPERRQIFSGFRCARDA
jgi:iron(II)-dependent oxidoreductase